MAKTKYTLCAPPDVDAFLKKLNEVLGLRRTDLLEYIVRQWMVVEKAASSVGCSRTQKLLLLDDVNSLLVLKGVVELKLFPFAIPHPKSNFVEYESLKKQLAAIASDLSDSRAALRNCAVTLVESQEVLDHATSLEKQLNELQELRSSWKEVVLPRFDVVPDEILSEAIQKVKEGSSDPVYRAFYSLVFKEQPAEKENEHDEST